MKTQTRVASFNLRGLKDDAAAAAEVIRMLDPDVLLLQEIPRHPLSGLRLAWFARRCNLNWSGRTRRLSGTGLMTSHRVEATALVDRKLPVARWANPRSYTAAQVRVPSGRPITVASVHLPLIAEQRHLHAARILHSVGARRALSGITQSSVGEGPGHSIVLGGDLNESSHGRAWRLEDSQLPLASPEQLTFPAARPQHWIDAIFTSRDLSVLPHQDVALDPGLVTAATDHYPVWIDLLVD